ncbi:MAG TPA: DUF1570 domain-containing protein [Pirellula sp.]|nr:DUF1570 domain-containing protein [Pirellula sp.]
MRVKDPLKLKSHHRPISGLFAAFLASASGCNVEHQHFQREESLADVTMTGFFVAKNSKSSETDTGSDLVNCRPEERKTYVNPSQTAPEPMVLDRYSIPGNQYRNADKRPPVLAVRMPDHTAFGVPIGLFSDHLFLMRNDGTIQQIKNGDIVHQAILNDRFRSIERSEFAQQLRTEFGRSYVVKSELPYLIVARPEQIEKWCKRFRSFHYSFKLYCSTHGLQTRDIEFPLVAVVFGSRTEFQRYSRSEPIKVPESVVGYYMPDTNRILLYEDAGPSNIATEKVICHEATHQLAFNTGLHQRRASTPLWLAEGFASMFEAPMLSGSQNCDGKSLWPESRKHTWQLIAKRPESIHRLMAGLVQNDSAFESDAQNAYAVAWAMATYLSQRSPKMFGPYLNRISDLPPFETYRATQRVEDFQSAFGVDIRLLSKKIIKYLETLD